MNSEEFLTALDVIEKEKKISREEIISGMEQALAAGYKKHTKGKTNVEVEINPETAEMKMFSILEVVEDLTEEDFEDESDARKIILEDAVEIDKNLKVGDIIKEEINPTDFGRVATQIAKQVIKQKIREAERESIHSEFEDKEDEMLTGIVFRQDDKNYYIDLGRSLGILPKTELIPGEKIEMSSSIKVYVTKIEKNTKGPLILLSRKHFGFLKRLLELEIPELQDGTILLHSVARKAGVRSKIAVYSSNSKVEPVGACIGEKGSRINRISDLLNGEKIDVVRYEKDPKLFIENALSPAKNASVFITDEKKQESIVVLDSENLSLGIGKKGINVQLASILTGYRIDVKTIDEAKELGIVIGG